MVAKSFWKEASGRFISVIVFYYSCRKFVEIFVEMK